MFLIKGYKYSKYFASISYSRKHYPSSFSSKHFHSKYSIPKDGSNSYPKLQEIVYRNYIEGDDMKLIANWL